MANKNKNIQPSPFHKKGKNEGDSKRNWMGRLFSDPLGIKHGGFLGFGEGETWGSDEWGISDYKDDMDKSFEDFQSLKAGAGENLYAGMENKLDLSNTMEDLTVGEGYDWEKDQVGRTAANTLNVLGESAGATGSAGLAQQLMESITSKNQQIGDKISIADQANQLASAKQRAANQLAIGEADMAVQKMILGGEKEARDLQINMQQAELSYLAGLKEAAEANKDAETAGKSDRRLKKNINKIGQSASGLNIYSFEYKNPLDGEGLFQGVMSDEVPQEAVINNGEYDMVNYGMLDVEFKQI